MHCTLSGVSQTLHDYKRRERRSSVGKESEAHSSGKRPHSASPSATSSSDRGGRDKDRGGGRDRERSRCGSTCFAFKRVVVVLVGRRRASWGLTWGRTAWYGYHVERYGYHVKRSRQTYRPTPHARKYLHVSVSNTPCGLHGMHTISPKTPTKIA